MRQGGIEKNCAMVPARHRARKSNDVGCREVENGGARRPWADSLASLGAVTATVLGVSLEGGRREGCASPRAAPMPAFGPRHNRVAVPEERVSLPGRRSILRTHAR